MDLPEATQLSRGLILSCMPGGGSDLEPHCDLVPEALLSPPAPCLPQTLAQSFLLLFEKGLSGQATVKGLDGSSVDSGWSAALSFRTEGVGSRHPGRVTAPPLGAQQSGRTPAP